MNVGDPITALADETKLSTGLEGLRGIPVEAKLIAHGGEATDSPWWQWQIRGGRGTGFITIGEEGRTWLHGWGDDKRAALLLVCSAA